MHLTFWRSGLAALIIGLAATASPAQAGTATFNLTSGSGSPSAATVNYNSVTTSGLSSLGIVDGTYNITGGVITANFLANTVGISGVTPPALGSFPFTALGTIADPTLTGPTAGYGSIAFSTPSQATAFQSYSFNVALSGSTVTGGTFTLSTEAVPEPSAFAMGATALVGLVAVRRRAARSRS